MKAQKQKMSIIKKMLIAVVAGFAVGILCLFIKGQINADVWDVVDAYSSKILQQQKVLKVLVFSIL